MARSVALIQSQIETTLVSSFADVGVTIDTTKWSKTNILRLLCFVGAVCANYIEQLMDILKSEMETQNSKAVGASSLWLQSKMFDFQYSSTNPQVLQVIDNVPKYGVIDDSLKIIKACAVVSPSLNNVIVKVAKGSPLEALSNDEISSAQGYANWMFTTGIDYLIQSNDSDKIYIKAKIYYSKQYSAVIQQTVIDAINNLFLNLSITDFNGALKITDIENTIRGVVGVNDVVFIDVKGRSDIMPFASAVSLVENQTLIIRQWGTIAGYCVAETEVGYTLTDSLTFIGE